MIVAAIILFDVLFITAVILFWRMHAVRMAARSKGLGLGYAARVGSDDTDTSLDDGSTEGSCRPLEPIQLAHYHPSDDLDGNYPIGLVNPASGLPMMSDSSFDVAGNPFGTDWSQSAASQFDSFDSSTSCGGFDNV